MTEYELEEVVRKAVARALGAGAPGLSEVIRGAIVSDAMRTVRRHLNMPKPPLPTEQSTSLGSGEK